MVKRILTLALVLLLVVILLHYPMIRFVIGVSNNMDSSYKGHVTYENLSMTHEFMGKFHKGDLELFNFSILKFECVIDDPLLVAVPALNDAYVSFDKEDDETSSRINYLSIYDYLRKHLKLGDDFVLTLDKDDLEALYEEMYGTLDFFLWEDITHGEIHIDKSFESFVVKIQLGDKLLTGEYVRTHDMMITKRDIIDLEDVKEEIMRFIEDVKDLYEG
jgi:hypothetical protein